MKQILFSECIPNFLPYECFAMHMMTCQILVLGQNTRGVTAIPSVETLWADSVLESPITRRFVEYSTTTANGVGGGERLATMADDSTETLGAMARAIESSKAEAGAVDAMLESRA